MTITENFYGCVWHHLNERMKFVTLGMHKMGKPDTVQQHQHRIADGRKDHYTSQKQTDKVHHKVGNASGSKADSRSSKSHGITQIPGAIRVCGDWSEQLSSNGKLYFFNIKTKSSQWERPKEWSNSRAIDVKKEKSKSQHNRAGLKHPNDASVGSHHTGLKQHKTAHAHGADARKSQTQQHARHRTNHESHSSKEYKDRDYRTTNSSSSSNAKDRDYRDLDYRDKRSSDSHQSINLVDSSRSQQMQDRDYRSSSSDNRHAVSRQFSETGTLHGRDHNGKHVSLLDNAQSHSEMANSKDGELSKDERSKSSSGTPASSQDAPKAVGPLAEDGAGGDGATVANGGEGTSSLVRTLSTVLNQASQSTTEDKTDSTSLEGNLKNALQMLLSVAAQNQQIPGPSEETETKAVVETPSKRPRLADAIDEHISQSLGLCKNAEKVLETLRCVYEERYTTHVQGWPADQMERQSVRLCDENHQFVVNHTSQLSASMKLSRSQVRSAEIHSTMQEQRVLYLRQQVKDLEKPSTAAPFT